MNPRPLNHPSWRRNANLFQGYEPEDGELTRQSMRLITQRQEPIRRVALEDGLWATTIPDFSDAILQFNAFQLSMRANSIAQWYGAQGLLQWWGYWALRRIRTALSQFVRRRIPRIDESYRLRRATERTSGPSYLTGVRNYVPRSANLLIGKRNLRQVRLLRLNRAGIVPEAN